MKEIKLRNEKTPASPIPEREYERFKYKLEEISGDFKERNMMLFYLGVATGYRLQDIVNLTIGELKEAIEFEELRIQEQKQYKSFLKHIKKYPMSKRKSPKKRVVLIKPKLKKMLKSYVRNKYKSEYAFKSNKGNGYIKAKSYSKILSNAAKELDMENISGHSLRKTYVTRIWDNTGDLELCRKALGHKSIETTKEYLGIALDIREEAANITDSKL